MQIRKIPGPGAKVKYFPKCTDVLQSLKAKILGIFLMHCFPALHSPEVFQIKQVDTGSKESQVPFGSAAKECSVSENNGNISQVSIRWRVRDERILQLASLESFCG